MITPAELLWIAIPAISTLLYGLLFMLRRQDMARVARWFSAFLGSAAIWSFGSMLLHANLGIVDPVWVARLVMLGNYGMPLAMFAFTVHYLSLPRQQAWIPYYIGLYLLTCGLNVAGLIVTSTEVTRGLVSNQYGIGMAGVALLWTAGFYPAVFLLIRELRHTKDAVFANRLKYLLVTFALLLGASLSNVTSLAAYPVDHLFAALTALLVSLSISRYQLLEIRHAVQRLAVLLLIIAGYIGIATGALLVLAGMDRSLLPLASAAAALATAVLLFSYPPVRQGMIGLIDRVFFPQQYNVQALIYAISRTSNRLRPSSDLGLDILHELARAMRCEFGHLFLKPEGGALYEHAAIVGTWLPGDLITFRADSPLVHELARYRLAMQVDRLHELSRMQALWIDEWDALRNLHAAVLVPISSEKELIGFFTLSVKTSGDSYSRQELQQILPLLANQVSIALANSQLYVQEQTRANQLAQTNTELRQAQAALNESAEQIRREAARAEALVRIADRLNAQLDLTTVLGAVCEETARALNVSAASVSLFADKSNVLIHAYGIGLPDEYVKQTQPIPREVYDGYSQSAGTVVVDAEAMTGDGMPDAQLCDELDIHTIMYTSMMREGQLVGSLNVFMFGVAHRFTEDELDLLKGIAAQAAQAIVNARLFADAQRRLRNMESLREVDAAITGGIDLRATLRVILDQVTSQLGIDAADVLLLDVPSNTLVYSEGKGFRYSLGANIPPQQFRDRAGAAVDERRLIRMSGSANGSQHPIQSYMAGEDFIAYLGVPLIAKGQVKGVLEIFQRDVLDPSKEWLSFLEALSTQAAIAIDNGELVANLKRSNDELSEAYESTLLGWARALEMRDQETEGHTRRVVEMTLKLAESMGIDGEDLVHIRRGAVLHDIGKMGVPDSILLKPGPLTPEEWRIMRQHPAYAYEMVSSISFLRQAWIIPFCHHEKWDGTGYPRGLKGEEIPLWARIFAVVDVWDALRSDRPYHAAWPDDKVRALIVEQRGHHFDPRIVDAFLPILDAEPPLNSLPSVTPR